MPFTPAHVAAAVPFARTRLVTSALVIGCMAPDFMYFMRFSARGGFGHRLPGVFLFDLPVSLIALWLFHRYAKEPLYSWLPAGVRQRIKLGPARWPINTLAQFGMVVFSILVGVATHIFWDSFTHRDFYPYHHWEFLRRMVVLPVIGHIEYLRIIQHTSTIFGFAVLLLWFRSWYRDARPARVVATEVPATHRRVSLMALCVIALMAGLLRGYVTEVGPANFNYFKSFFEDTVITSITVFCMGVVVLGAYRIRLQSQMQDALTSR